MCERLEELNKQTEEKQNAIAKEALGRLQPNVSELLAAIDMCIIKRLPVSPINVASSVEELRAIKYFERRMDLHKEIVPLMCEKLGFSQEEALVDSGKSLQSAEKFWYKVELYAETQSEGYVLLTPEEAQLVASVTNYESWKKSNLEGYSGSFGIEVEKPLTQEEFDALEKYNWEDSEDEEV